MNIKQFSIGTLVGGVILFLLGYLVYGVLLASFYEANVGSASGVSKGDDMSLPLIFIGNLALGALLSYVYLQWANISTFASGFRAAFILGLLMTMSWNLINFGSTNIMNLTGALVDIIVYAVMIGITGGVIGVVLGRTKK
jgi:hypothetical protein